MAAQTLIGTFGPASRYPGQQVTYEDGQFTIQGSGPVSPVALEAWATAGQLEWVSPEMGAWVHDRTRPGAIPPPAAAATASGAPPLAPPPPADERPSRPRGRRVLIGAGVAVLALVVVGGALALGRRSQHQGSAAHHLDPRCYGDTSGALGSTMTKPTTILFALLRAADNSRAPAAWGCQHDAWADWKSVDSSIRDELLAANASAGSITATSPAYDGQSVRFRAYAMNAKVGWFKQLGYYTVVLVKDGHGEWRLGTISRASAPTPDASTTLAPSSTTPRSLAPTVPPTNAVSQRAEIVAKTLSMPGALGGSFTTVSFQVESAGQVIAGGDQTFTVDEDLSGGLQQTSDRAAYVNALVQQLEGQGWTDVGTGSQWYNHQFTK